VVIGLVCLKISGLVDVEALQTLVANEALFLRQEARWTGPVFVLLDLALIVACQPGTLLMEIGAGYVYGVWLGVSLVFVAKIVGAAVCYYLGQFFFNDWVDSILKKNATFQKLKYKSNRSAFNLVLGLRLSPVPSYLCSYSASAMNAPFRSYMAATALATLPSVLNHVYLGHVAVDVAAVFSGGGVLGSSFGAMDYVKIALPLAGTVLLFRFFTSLVAEED